MSASTQVMFGILLAFGYLVTPILMIWGWTRWLGRPKLRTIPSILSLIGFVLATCSALLAVSLVGYAQIHHFPYYDPTLLRAFRLGALLSLAGILFALSGMWRPSSLRWHAFVCSLGALVFWIVAASGE